jgi:hypothetical protein
MFDHIRAEAFLITTGASKSIEVLKADAFVRLHQAHLPSLFSAFPWPEASRTR